MCDPDPATLAPQLCPGGIECPQCGNASCACPAAAAEQGRLEGAVAALEASQGALEKELEARGAAVWSPACLLVTPHGRQSTGRFH